MSGCDAELEEIARAIVEWMPGWSIDSSSKQIFCNDSGVIFHISELWKDRNLWHEVEQGIADQGLSEAYQEAARLNEQPPMAVRICPLKGLLKATADLEPIKNHLEDIQEENNDR